MDPQLHSLIALAWCQYKAELKYIYRIYIFHVCVCVYIYIYIYMGGKY